MIQEIYPHQFRNEYRPEKPENESFLLMYEGREAVFYREGDEISYPTVGEAEKILGPEELDWTYLFSIDGERYYMLQEEQEKKVIEVLMLQKNAVKESASAFRTAKPQYLAFAGITGYQLHGWYKSRRFCGVCGHPLKHDKKERMMYCEHCGQMEYPKICPAVIVGVTDGDRIVLTKYANSAYKKYALIAGFTEIGESIEETVRREVKEEVGLDVKNIRYYKSQPWSFSDTLLMGFFCELDGDNTIQLEEEELSVGEWVKREDIPADGKDISLTSDMMWNFKCGNVDSISKEML